MSSINTAYQCDLLLIISIYSYIRISGFYFSSRIGKKSRKIKIIQMAMNHTTAIENTKLENPILPESATLKRSVGAKEGMDMLPDSKQFALEWIESWNS
ncbi:MAG: hypothetical protein WCW68_10570, partial [Methanothrix sp.]